MAYRQFVALAVDAKIKLDDALGHPWGTPIAASVCWTEEAVNANLEWKSAHLNS